MASQKSAMDAIASAIWSKGSRGGTLLCRRRNELRRGSVQVRPYPCWESRGCPGRRRPADRRRRCRRRLWPRRLPDRQPINSGGIRRRFGSPLSMRRKSPTSAWRRSISSTKTTWEAPSRACNLLLTVEEAAAADTAAAAPEAAAAFGAAASEAAEAAALASAAAGAAASAGAAAAGEAAAAAAAAPGAGGGPAAAACRGEVATSARPRRLAVTMTDARRYARV